MYLNIRTTPKPVTGPYPASGPLMIRKAARPSQSSVPKATWEGWMRDEALVRQIRNKQGGRGSILTMEDPFEVLKRTLGGD